MALCCSEVKIVVCIIVVLFGMGSWISINGIFVELPILVEHLPEGWNLPSYMAVISQIANIGPISVTVANLCAPKKTKERPIVFVMLIIGTLSSILLAFFWSETSFIFGEERSTAFLSLVLFLSLVDCTSSVVFLPFMSLFKPPYMTIYFIGEGFSGLLPSLVALGQGAGNIKCINDSIVNSTTNETEYSIQSVYVPPKFPLEDFFLFLFAMMVTCGVSFLLLNYLPYCKEEHAYITLYEKKIEANTYELETSVATSVTAEVMKNNYIKQEDDNHQAQDKSIHVGVHSNNSLISTTSDSHSKMSKRVYCFFLVLIGWINGLTNGVLISVQTYACLPYGPEAYHLSVTLINIVNPVACFIAFFLPVKSRRIIGSLTAIGSFISIYIIFVAASSPSPPLIDSIMGDFIVVSMEFKLIPTFSVYTCFAS